MNDIESIQSIVLAIGEKTSVDDVAAAIDYVSAVKEKAAELKRTLDQVLIEYIHSNGKFTIGTMEYAISTPKETKCLDVAGVVQTIFEKHGRAGVQKLIDILSTQPFKDAAAKKALEDNELAEKFFKTTWKEKLKITGEKEEQLVVTNTAFLPKALPDQL